jgi:argininosuccinate lyase
VKIWQKENSISTNKRIEDFTISRDRELDVHLAPFDILGSMAHTIMLEKCGLIEANELKSIVSSCRRIYEEVIKKGLFEVEDGIEDVHSQIEWMLTKELGDAGKKIHSGRSRNDQVLVDLKMYMRQKVTELVFDTQSLFKTLQQKSEKHKADLLPGYTHLQIAMPSSFGLWFGAYAEALLDDVEIIKGAYKVINKNPLGSGAGYGSSFPLDRKLTTNLLGFTTLNYNVVYAQMTRGKVEGILLSAIANLAGTLGKMAMDVCLYNSQNFGFIKLPEEMTTGSSIMPHKKNPDVAEVLRAKSNRLKALPNEVNYITTNLPSGYHRDLQITKEILMPAIDDIKECLSIAEFMMANLEVKKDLLEDKKYDLLFSVENVNQMVVEGTPFRDAYKKIGFEINEGNFTPNRSLNHTLEGSIGNLCNDEIAAEMDELIASFGFEKVENAFEKLLNWEV